MSNGQQHLSNVAPKPGVGIATGKSTIQADVVLLADPSLEDQVVSGDCLRKHVRLVDFLHGLPTCRMCPACAIWLPTWNMAGLKTEDDRSRCGQNVVVGRGLR